MFNLLLVIAAIFCAFQVMRTGRLLNVTIWLAFTSALVAILIYSLGAPDVAVIELSVGAGLVTVLFVFAFSIVGEATLDEPTFIPRWLVWLLVMVIAFVLGWFVFPIPAVQTRLLQIPFGTMLWERRGLDVIAQVVLIFSGVMGLIGLLSETRLAARKPIPEMAGPQEHLGASADPSMSPSVQPEEVQE